MKNCGYYIITLFLSFCLSGFSQTMLNCGADQYEILLLQHSDYQRQSQELEKEYCAQMQNPTLQRSSGDLTIPVVFHIIHDGGPENISDAQVLQGLAHLNEAFANSGPYQNGNGVDTHIRFCLAQRDEEGDLSSGIERYATPYTDMALFAGYEYVKSIEFDPARYLNIQIVQNACLGSDCSVAGFAGANRIVIEAQYFGGSLINDIVIIHEMGHALGLAHTWKGGCKNGNCLEDGDRVCDTPPDNRTNEHCFIATNSCSSDVDDTSISNPFRPISLGGLGDQPDDHTNFMDYNWWECLDHFTRGQAERMQFFVQHRYASLLESKSCLPPCTTQVVAQFVAPDSITVGSTLTITNASTQAGSNQWSVDGTLVSSEEHLTYTFSETGSVTLKLEVVIEDTLCENAILTQDIIVYCPVEACLEYQIHGQYLVFEDCSIQQSVVSTIATSGADTLLATSQSIDSIDINNKEFVRLCITANNAHCEDTYCAYINISSNGMEICGNGEDDDADGLIDLFDPDCPCSGNAYQAQCQTGCEILLDSFPDFQMQMKWESVKLQKFLSVGSAYSVFDPYENGDVQIMSSYGNGVVNDFKNYCSFIDGETGELSDTFRIFPEYDFYEFTTPFSVARNSISLDYNIYTSVFGQLLSTNISGVEIFRNSHPAMIGSIGISDFNGDGEYEVFDGDVVFNGQNGSILYIGRERDCTTGGCEFFIPVSADVVGDDHLPELITGKYVYDISLINSDGTSGNSATVIQAPDGVEDGKCGVGDIDGDGRLDVISVKGRTNASNGGIWVWNPRTQSMIAFAASGLNIPLDPGGGSIPFIGDVDGDCLPEIGVVFSYKLNMYKYNGSQNLELLYSLNTSDESGRTGVTMFDFDQDGKQELVYRDEDYLRIIEGATGRTIDSVMLFSKTWSEYPIVADVDNDGEAEIIVSGSLTSKDEVRLYCFESASAPWAPARSVWNQYAYNPTQINDDLTVPRYQQNAAQPLQGTGNCPRETCNTPYNNFMVQATYRTQAGCYVWPELQRDLSVSAESRCIGDSIEICIYTKSAEPDIIDFGVPLSLYHAPWESGTDDVLTTLMITSDTTCILLPKMTDTDSIMVVINDDGGSYPPDFAHADIAECDYTNNTFVLYTGGPDFGIDIIDYMCTPDSVILYIATEIYMPGYIDTCCYSMGCYYLIPPDHLNDPDPDSIIYESSGRNFKMTGESLYRDTFRVSIPLLPGLSEIWWTINEGGFGPGLQSSEVTGFYECNYQNNVDSVSVDFSELVLDLGPDITKCATEVLTLHAGDGFETYLWTDLTIDSIYSAIGGGIHAVEATDQCGRIYRDTVLVTIDESADIDLGPDMMVCPGEDTTLTVVGDYDQVFWSSSGVVSCDTCMSTIVSVDSITSVYILAINGNCISYDTVEIGWVVPDVDTTLVSACPGDTLEFFGQQITVSGVYENLSSDCGHLDILDVVFAAPDTTWIDEQICISDSILFNGQYHSLSGLYTMASQNTLGCDSIVILVLDVVEALMETDTVKLCAMDSVEIFGEWIHSDTTLQQTMTASSGCDSTQRFIIVSGAIESNLQFQLCPGDSIHLYNSWYQEDGNYQIVIANAEGCDSIISLDIFVSDTLNTSEDILLCPGDSLWLNGDWISSEGEYKTIISSATGCDSTHTVSVRYVEDPPSPQTAVDCEEMKIVLSIDPKSGWSPIWSNGDTTFQSSFSNGVLEAGLTLHHQPNCAKQLSITLPVLPDAGDIPILADTIIQAGQTFIVDLGLDAREWSVRWSNHQIVSCDTCMTVEITPIENTEIFIDLQHESGCYYETSFIIRLQEEDEGIYIPNIFSPNGDQHNDVWTIFASDDIQLRASSIFDRWGNVVYVGTGEQVGWDGSFRGQLCAPGVYVYMIEYVDGLGTLKTVAGDLTLIR